MDDEFSKDVEHLFCAYSMTSPIFNGGTSLYQYCNKTDKSRYAERTHTGDVKYDVAFGIIDQLLQLDIY